MGTSLLALPDELLLRIVQNVSQVRNLTVTQKIFSDLCRCFGADERFPL